MPVFSAKFDHALLYLVDGVIVKTVSGKFSDVLDLGKKGLIDRMVMPYFLISKILKEV